MCSPENLRNNGVRVGHRFSQSSGYIYETVSHDTSITSFSQPATTPSEEPEYLIPETSRPQGATDEMGYLVPQNLDVATGTGQHESHSYSSPSNAGPDCHSQEDGSYSVAVRADRGLRA